MKKRLAFLLSLLCILGAVCSFSAYAAEDCSLTLSYVDEQIGPMVGTTFRLYTIAEGYSAHYNLAKDFAGCAADLTGMNWGGAEDMANLAAALSEHVQANDVAPSQTLTTDAKGQLTFGGLVNGLYLALGETVIRDGWVYTQQPVLLWLPCLSPTGEKDSHPVCEPKHDKEPELFDLTVRKIWVGEGTHPQSVTVQLLCDGEVYDEVTLDAENGWRHTWEGIPTLHEWEIVEKDVPDGYTASVSRDGATFTVTNTKDTTTTTSSGSPKTGDDTYIVLWILLLTVSCIGIIRSVVPQKKKRTRNEE